jgi:hypothetical protein
MSKTTVLAVAVTVTGLASMMSLPASAADKPTFNANAQKCTEIVWREDVLAKYPKVDLACEDVVEKGGQRYVKFHGEVVAQTKDGIKIEFPRTGYATEIKVADKNKETYVDGKAKRLGSLATGDAISVYVPSDRFVVSFLDEKAQALGEGTLGQ